MADFNDYKWYSDDYEKSRGQIQDGNSGGTNHTIYTETVIPKKKKRAKTWIASIAGIMAAVVLVGGGAVGYKYLGSGQDAAQGGNANNLATDPNTSFHFEQLTNGEQKAMSVVDIAKEVGPAVVGITNTAQVQSFFGVSEQQSSGSGVIISQEGYIVTNNHVVEGAKELSVQLNTGEEYSAKLIGTDAQTDLAVIKIEPKGTLTVAKLGESAKLQVGELAVAIGNPLGAELSGSVTMGIISGLNRTIQTDSSDPNSTMTLIQTDAAINPGNSGGALINGYGEVIGINNMKYSDEKVEGIGFAIPVDTVKTIVNDLIESGYVKGRPLIGITVQEVTSDIAFRNNLPIGLYVAQVSELGPADRAGMQRGDVITAVNGKKIETSRELNEIKNNSKVGDVLTFTVQRDDKKMDIAVTLQEDKSRAAAPQG